MKMKIVLLFFVLIFGISCKDKNKNNTSIKLITSTNSLIENAVTEKSGQKNNCLKSDVKPLKLPIDGGENLMSFTIENDIELQVLKCDVSIIKSKLCNTDFISYYSLPNKNDLNPIIIADEYGDNNNSYTLVIHKEDKITDFVLLYNSWIEMSENPKKEITDFKISKEYEIIISKQEYKNNIQTKQESINYQIDKNGKLLIQ